MLDEATDHGSFTSNIVTTESSVGSLFLFIQAIEITRDYLFKSKAIRIINVIVYDVHNQTHIRLMVGCDSFLQFQNACIRVLRVTGKATFWNVILDRIIAPVVDLFRVFLIYTTKIINRHELDMGDSQIQQMLHTNFTFAQLGRLCQRSECARFFKTSILLAREVANTHLVNDGFGWAQLCFGPLDSSCIEQFLWINNKASTRIGFRGKSIRIMYFQPLTIDLVEIGVASSLPITRNRCFPNAFFLTKERPDSFFAIFFQLDQDLLGDRSPEGKRSSLRRISCTKIILVVVKSLIKNRFLDNMSECQDCFIAVLVVDEIMLFQIDIFFQSKAVEAMFGRRFTCLNSQRNHLVVRFQSKGQVLSIINDG